MAEVEGGVAKECDEKVGVADDTKDSTLKDKDSGEKKDAASSSGNKPPGGGGTHAGRGMRGRPKSLGGPGGRGRARGRGGAMAAFKQMDAATAPAGGVKANIGGGKVDPKSPGAIKQNMLNWCQRATKDYIAKGVNITNFGSSFSDGLAFCALIHRFRPKAFDFDKLEAKNRRENFQLAFDAAEKEADICPLLEVDDMVRFKVPDWKCVFTQIQLYYRAFHTVDLNASPHEDGEGKAAATAAADGDKEKKDSDSSNAAAADNQDSPVAKPDKSEE